MEYVELDNLSDEAILNLYDDVIAWTRHHCDGTGEEHYRNAYYGPANRYGYHTELREQGLCVVYPSITCATGCCEENEECSYGYSLKYSVYTEMFQAEP